MVARGEANEVSATPGMRDEMNRSPGRATETSREVSIAPLGLPVFFGRQPGVALTSFASPLATIRRRSAAQRQRRCSRAYNARMKHITDLFATVSHRVKPPVLVALGPPWPV